MEEGSGRGSENERAKGKGWGSSEGGEGRNDRMSDCSWESTFACSIVDLAWSNLFCSRCRFAIIDRAKMYACGSALTFVAILWRYSKAAGFSGVCKRKEDWDEGDSVSEGRGRYEEGMRGECAQMK